MLGQPFNMIPSQPYQQTTVTIDFGQHFQPTANRYPATIHHMPKVTMTTNLYQHQVLSDMYNDNKDQLRNFSSEGHPPESENHCCQLPGCTLNTFYPATKHETDYVSPCAHSDKTTSSISSVLSAMRSNNAYIQDSLPVLSGNLAESILNDETDSGYATPDFIHSPVLNEIQVEDVQSFIEFSDHFIKPEPVSPPAKRRHVQSTASGSALIPRKKIKSDHQCSECERSFSSQSNLRIHMRVHNGDRPYQCDFCLKCFAQRATLNTHRRTHTGEKPFKCDQCSRGFSDLSTFTKHKRKHTGERPYSCSICHKSFTQSGNMLRHMKTHR